MCMTLTERIISGEGFFAQGVRSSTEPAVVNALRAIDDSVIPPVHLGKETKKVFDKISKVNLHQSGCPCVSCEGHEEFFI